jgi:hypothetical protein
MSGLEFQLPAGFWISEPPTVNELAPTPADPGQEAGRSTVAGARRGPAGNPSELVIATYAGPVGAAAGQRSDVELFGATPVDIGSSPATICGSGWWATVVAINAGPGPGRPVPPLFLMSRWGCS